MVLIFDHLVSVLIASVVFLMLVTFQGTVSETAVGRTLLYQTKKQTLELADMLERDLINAGYGRPPGAGIEDQDSAILEGESVTESFDFWTDLNGVSTRVKYELDLVDIVELEGESIPLFKLTRFERIGGNWEEAGGSPPTLTDFEISMRTNNNQPTTDLTAARTLRIRLKNVIGPDIEVRGFLRGMRILRWGIQLRPENLGGFSA